MTDAEWIVVETYVRNRARELGLSDWDIVIEREPCDDDTAFAENATTPGRRYAKIKLCKRFRELTADEQRSTIIHELLHCHSAGIEHFLHADLKEHPALTSNEHAFIDAVGMRRIEDMIDGIAEAVALKYPVIQWPKRTK